MPYSWIGLSIEAIRKTTTAAGIATTTASTASVVTSTAIV